MSRFLVNDTTRVDSRAKLTTAVISNLVGLQATQKRVHTISRRCRT